LATDEVVIAGDMNARVSDVKELPDVVGELDLEEHAGVYVGGNAVTHGIPARECKDGSSNRFGNKLADMCKGQGLVILNGRVAGDQNGEFTFWSKGGPGGSVIDLFVTSPALFWKAVHLTVGDIPVAGDGDRSRRVA
jgi:hypothetical protein